MVVCVSCLCVLVCLRCRLRPPSGVCISAICFVLSVCACAVGAYFCFKLLCTYLLLVCHLPASFAFLFCFVFRVLHLSMLVSSPISCYFFRMRFAHLARPQALTNTSISKRAASNSNMQAFARAIRWFGTDVVTTVDHVGSRVSELIEELQRGCANLAGTSDTSIAEIRKQISYVFGEGGSHRVFVLFRPLCQRNCRILVCSPHTQHTCSRTHSH